MPSCPKLAGKTVGPWDGTAAYQVVGGVTDHQAYDGYGL
jgi:hypothetical protein